MPYSTDIKFFSSTNLGLPSLTNEWGKLIPLLDACLTGDGQTAQSIASLSINDKLLTITTAADHKLQTYQVVRFTGSGITALDKDHRITSISGSTSFVVELTTTITIPSDLSGISYTLAPLNFEKTYTGTNKAAYRSKNTNLLKRSFLRIEDGATSYPTSAKYGRVGIVDSMTGIDTLGGAQSPYDTASPNKNWTVNGTTASSYNGWATWPYAYGSFNSSTTFDIAPSDGARVWYIVGNGDYFYFIIAPHGGQSAFWPFFFGDPGDKKGPLLHAWVDYAAMSSKNIINAIGLVSTSAARGLLTTTTFSSSDISGETTAVVALSNTSQAATTYSGYNTLSTNNPLCTDIYLRDTSTPAIRGILQGIKWLHCMRPYGNLSTVMIDNNPYLTPFIVAGDASYLGQVAIKLADLV